MASVVYMRDKSDFEFVTANGMQAAITFRSDSDTFSAFYDAYDNAFVLPNEKETREGFAAALNLNRAPLHATLAKQYGPFAECCLLAFHDGRQIGGADLFAATAANSAGERCVTANLNYLFVDHGLRGRGYMRRLLDVCGHALREMSRVLATGTEPVLIFVEQNDPFRLSAEQYLLDTQVSGIDQFERLNVWARLGARFIDFPYVQPALSADQAPDATLVYSLLGDDRHALDPALLHQHLERFFAISVRKGAPLLDDASAMFQLAELERLRQQQKQVGVHDFRGLLQELVRHVERFSRWQPRPRTLFEAADLSRRTAFWLPG